MLVVDSAIANLIRENKTFRINSAIQTGAKQGMQLLDDHLFKLWQEGKVIEEEVLIKANNAEELEKAHRQRQTRHVRRRGRYRTQGDRWNCTKPEPPGIDVSTEATQGSRSRRLNAEPNPEPRTLNPPHGYSSHRSNPGRSRLHRRRSARTAAGRTEAAAGRIVGQSRRIAGLHYRRATGPGAGRANGHARGEPGRDEHAARRAGENHRADGAAVPRRADRVRRQHADDRHVRSAKAHHSRRAAHVPGLRHQSHGRHRARRRQGARQVLRHGQRKRRKPRRRHGGRRRTAQERPKPWKPTARST